MDARIWSVSEDATLKRLYRRRPAAAIAAELGRTRPEVYRRAALLGLMKPLRSLTAEDLERIAAMIAAEIARPVGEVRAVLAAGDGAAFERTAANGGRWELKGPRNG
jgi:hypothetical protein